LITIKNKTILLSTAWRIAGLLMLSLGLTAPASAQQAPYEPYYVQAGDTLEVSVWKEEDLQKQVLVRPDGRISFPLIGDIDVAGRTIDELRQEITDRLVKFIPDLTVTVTIQSINGNRIYVIGKVNSPGSFVVNPRVDVMQALSLAGGTTAFAALDDIIILRRESDGSQRAISFQYKDVARGRSLDQNVILHSGDFVVVP
jgi:polysaccharide export outer membrane protein